MQLISYFKHKNADSHYLIKKGAHHQVLNYTDLESNLLIWKLA